VDPGSQRSDGSAAGTLRYGTPAGWGVLAAVVTGSALAFLDATVVNVALPTIGRDLDATFSQLQWVVTGYTLTLAAFILVSGSLADRHGRRRVYLVGMAAFAATSLLCAAAPSIESLIVARMLQGVAGALVTPGSLAIIEASFVREDRGRAIGMWAGVTGLAPAVGPPLGGWLTELDWRWVFLINVPVALVGIVLARRYVPESADPNPPQRLDWPGAVLAVVALGGVTISLIFTGSDGPAGDPILVLTTAGLGLAAAVGFVWWERRTAWAMVPLRLFANRTFALTNLLTLGAYAALTGMLFFLAIQLQTTLGYRPMLAGLANLPVPVVLLLFSAQAGALPTRVGPRLPLVLGPIVAGVGLAMLATVDAGSSYLTGVLPGLLVFGAGLVLLVAPLTSTVLASAPNRLAGTASGVNNAISRTGGLLAVAALPTLVGLTEQDYSNPAALAAGYRAAMLVSAGLLVLSGLVALAIPRSLDACRPAEERGTGSAQS
jgi:EmrB/QacA subfamily drug resistance transporter